MNNRLNEYLSELETHLRFLPDADREPEIAEIAAHLNALIAVRVAEGQTDEGAPNAALVQFGDACDIGKRLRQTRHRQRFTTFGEIALFSAAFSVPLNIVSRAIRHFCSSYLHTSALSDPLLHWPPPVGVVIGLAAFIVLVLRYGGHGILKKAWGPSPIGAAVRWLLLVMLLNLPIQPSLMNALLKLLRVSSQLSQTNALLAVASSYTLYLLVSGGAAFWVGRSSKSQKSVADGVGVAVTVGALITLLQMVWQFIPVPGRPAPTPFLANVEGYLTGTAFIASYGIVRFFVARLCVQIGEARRASQDRQEAVL